jgi:hypothetical protein
MDDTLFTVLNSIFLKNKIEYDQRIAPPYILTLWLSHDRSLLPMTNKLNKHLFNLPAEKVYQYFYFSVPKGKRFIRWPRKSEKDKQREKKIEQLCEEHNISKKEASLFIRGE